MDSEVNLSTKNSFPFLTFVGINPYEEDFVQTSMRHIQESKLDYKALTNGFVLELWNLVETKDPDEPKLHDGKSPSNITRRQFAEIVGCILFDWSPNQITRTFIKQVCYPRDLKNLKLQVDNGTLSEHDLWRLGQKLVSKNKENLRAQEDSTSVPGTSCSDQSNSAMIEETPSPAGDQIVINKKNVTNMNSENQGEGDEADLLEELDEKAGEEIPCPSLSRLLA